MERQLLWELYRWMIDQPRTRIKYVQFSDLWIALTYLWAVLCDRPICWACVAANWPADFRWFSPPSPATMSRRLKTPSVQALQQQLLARLNPPPEPQPSTVHWCDGKPLTVGGASGDPDVRAGRGAGMLAKGYKLHAIIAANHAIEAWQVTPLNVAEPVVVARLVEQLSGPGLLVGDHLFDDTSLYEAAGRRGLQLITSPDKHGTPLSHYHRQHPRRVVGVMHSRTRAGRELLHHRFGIDRLFGQMGNRGGGLGPLPNWVRRSHRVTAWIGAKLLLFSFQRHRKLQHLRHR